MNKGLRGILPYPVKDLLHRRLPLLLVIYALFSGAPVTAQARDSNGYRSAHFGMTEAAVYTAIEADFAIPLESVKRINNATEKTSGLMIMVKDLVDHTGRAEITYIFGYQSKKLIQVNLLWRVPATIDGATDRLLWAARIMASRISLWGIPRHKIEPNTLTKEGATLLFRGQGKNGMVALISMRVSREDKTSLSGSTLTDAGSWLRVSFVDHAGAPDIFTIEPGQF